MPFWGKIVYIALNKILESVKFLQNDYKKGVAFFA